jgi:glycerol-3-phosphate acyltransferase PlsY
LIEHPPAIVVLCAAIAGAFIVVRHTSNLSRIRAGNENIFSLKGAKR